MKISSVLLVGNFNLGSLESSYFNAISSKGYNVEKFDIVVAEEKYCRFKPLGSILNKYLPVDAWQRKANRELILIAKRLNPDLIIYFGQNRFLVNAIAQIKAMTNSKHVLIWPDTLLNFGSTHILSLPLFDCVASYSKNSINSLIQLGGRNVIWLPLAGDPILHKREQTQVKFKYDVSFIGQYRPEREEAISYILQNLENVNVNIWGPDWRRRSKDKLILKSIRGEALYGADFSEVVQLSKINLNIIDDTNFPAANMRFFEIPILGGVEVCSLCPELEFDFLNNQHIFYYESLNHLVEIVKSILSFENIESIQSNAYNHAVNNHTYECRVDTLFEYMNRL